jgi:hypothetical protein
VPGRRRGTVQDRTTWHAEKPLSGVTDRLRQNDLLVGTEFHRLCQGCAVDAAAYHYAQAFRSAKEVDVLGNDARDGIIVKTLVLGTGAADFGKVGDVNQVHGRFAHVGLSPGRRTHVFTQDRMKLIALGVVRVESVGCGDVDVSLLPVHR